MRLKVLPNQETIGTSYCLHGSQQHSIKLECILDKSYKMDKNQLIHFFFFFFDIVKTSTLIEVKITESLWLVTIYNDRVKYNRHKRLKEHDSQSLILDDLLQNPLYIEEVFGIHKVKVLSIITPLKYFPKFFQFPYLTPWLEFPSLLPNSSFSHSSFPLPQFWSMEIKITNL